MSQIIVEGDGIRIVVPYEQGSISNGRFDAIRGAQDILNDYLHAKYPKKLWCGRATCEGCPHFKEVVSPMPIMQKACIADPLKFQKTEEIQDEA